MTQLLSIPPLCAPEASARPGIGRIAAVEIVRLHGEIPASAEGEDEPWCHNVAASHVHAAQAGVLPDGYPQPASLRGAARPRGVHQLFLEIRDDAGNEGRHGPINDAQATIIARDLRAWLMGRDAGARVLLGDLLRRVERHGRSGLWTCALSAVDCALWDLAGRHAGLPVHRLLGGPSRAAVPVYASMLGYSVEPGCAAERARVAKAEGWLAQKWFFAYGPAHGAEGMRKNLVMAEAVRAATGAGYPLMFDAHMGWDSAYAERMAQGLEAVEPHWLEEPLPPEDIESWCRLRARTKIPLATGEHVYGLAETLALLRAGVVDVLQNDPVWTGGVSEQLQVCALARAFGVPVAAHGHVFAPALHVAYAQPPAAVPWLECLVRARGQKQFFLRDPLRIERGEAVAPEAPGLGMALHPERVLRRERVSF